MRLALALIGLTLPAVLPAQPRPLRVFISVDMEGIGGIGTAAMTSSTGKDYATGRELMTAEVNAVVEAVLGRGPAEVLVNDSHGDMQNLLHTRLDPRVQYIQGAIKPFGMTQGLDSTYDAVIFVGYHAMARSEDGFLAHTGSGTVQGLWINGTEVGEGGLNAFLAASLGVPVVVAAGDSAFTREISALIPGVRTVSTKQAVGGQVAKLLHPRVVLDRLRQAVSAALGSLSSARPLRVAEPVTVRLRFDTTTRADIVEVIPGVRRIDGTTVEWTSATMRQAYPMVRLMYRYVGW
jgi:D-amino peptidase